MLTSLDLAWLDPAIFADAIHRKGAPLNQCWGFIDGTTRRIARPIRNQNVMYSGHKRIHCIKFQVWNVKYLTYIFWDLLLYQYFSSQSLVNCLGEIPSLISLNLNISQGHWQGGVFLGTNMNKPILHSF